MFKPLRLTLLLLTLGGTQTLVQASSLVVCTEASPEGFDIAQYTAATTADASAETLFDRLVHFVPGSTRLEPGLAESWTISPDGRVYEFQLRQGVKFHSTPWFTPSRDFNADDVLWSFQRQLDPQHPWHKLSPRGFPYAESMDLANLVEGIEKLNDHRVRFTLKQREAPFLANLAMGFTSLYSAEYGGQLLDAGKPEQLNREPVGTGPFIFERYRKDAQVRYRANPDYWAGRPAIDRLLFSISPDSNVRVQKLRAGECQIAVYPRPTDVAALRQDPALEVLELDSQLIAYIGINTRHAPLDDVRVRQAINLAFDTRSYIRAQYGEDNASIAVAPYPPTLLGYNDKLQPWPHDPERARRFLAEAGYEEGFTLSIWTRPGGTSTNPNPGIGAQMLQADLAAIGIQSEIRMVEWGELIKRAKNGEHDLVFMGWAGDNGDPDNFLTPNLSCGAVTSGENLTGWCNPEFDELIRRARALTDPEQRAPLYRQALAIFHEQAPWIPLAHPKQFVALRKGVEGYQLSPLGTNSFARVKLAP
ncbi:ABC transporter substrate-binding protein [Metapseudomonas furukawaii]|uniref:Dipeptide-binding ABC transporter n=1 Tax=Metapseudomonas furukawaii TaxID=1149133 RepID=A0AAD1BW42_METFU|nr:ABC transporter substrate-binding protein [Pseudomonas furukawaii]ELS26432.1 Dipeptide-binding ABC transporter, periplasmic substrate-binding component [Pseudomonas furukawaii]BAU72616.1 dipeptide-binding ABC transporter [Pseudomonas furukawaii]